MAKVVVSRRPLVGRVPPAGPAGLAAGREFETMSPPSSPLPAEFAGFLGSDLWEERNQAPLSVLSALARLDLDPWEAAAGLALLSPEGATRDLRTILARLPGAETCADLDLTCARAARRLPCAAAEASVRARPGPDLDASLTKRGSIQLFVMAAWMVLMSLVCGEFVARHGATAASPPSAEAGAGPTAQASPKDAPPPGG